MSSLNTVEALIWHVHRWGRPYFTERQLWRSLGDPPPDVRARVRQWLRFHPAFFRDRHARFYLRTRAVRWSGCIQTDAWDRAWFEPDPATGLSIRLPVLALPGSDVRAHQVWQGYLRPMPHRRQWQKWLRLQGTPLVFWPEARDPEGACPDVLSDEPGDLDGDRPVYSAGLWAVACRDYILHPWAARIETHGDRRVVEWYVGDGTPRTASEEAWPALGFRFFRTAQGTLHLEGLERCRVQVERWLEPTEAAARLRPLVTEPGPARFFYAPAYPALPCHLWVHPHVEWAVCLYDWYVQMERSVLRALADRGVSPVGRTGEVPVEGVWWLLLWLARHTGRLRLRRLWVAPSDWEEWSARLPDEDREAFRIALWTHGALHMRWRPLRAPTDWAPLPIWQGRSNPVEARWQDWLEAAWYGRPASYPRTPPQADGRTAAALQRRFLSGGGVVETSEALVMAALPEGLTVLLGPPPQRAWIPAESLRAAGYFFKATAWEWRRRRGRGALRMGSRLRLEASKFPEIPGSRDTA